MQRDANQDRCRQFDGPGRDQSVGDQRVNEIDRVGSIAGQNQSIELFPDIAVGDAPVEH